MVGEPGYNYGLHLALIRSPTNPTSPTSEALLWITDDDDPEVVERRPDGTWHVLFRIAELPDKRAHWELAFNLLIPMALLSLVALFWAGRAIIGRVFGVLSIGCLVPAVLVVGTRILDPRDAGGLMIPTLLFWVPCTLAAFIPKEGSTNAERFAPTNEYDAKIARAVAGAAAKRAAE